MFGSNYCFQRGSTMAEVNRWHAPGHAPDIEEIEKLLKDEGLDIICRKDPPQMLHNEVRHDEPEVLWVILGSLSIGIDEEEIKLDAGDRIEIPAGNLHWTRTEDVGATYIYAYRTKPE